MNLNEDSVWVMEPLSGDEEADPNFATFSPVDHDGSIISGLMLGTSAEEIKKRGAKAIYRASGSIGDEETTYEFGGRKRGRWFYEKR